VDLPVLPPVKPMLAKAVADVPDGAYLYEPKWDGFRCIVFKDGDEVELGSRNERPLTRYFPEVVEAVRTHLPPRCVVDGEIVIAGEVGLDFEALLQRIHPPTAGCGCWPRRRPRRSWRSTCSRWTGVAARRAAGRAPRAARAAARRRRAARPPHPRDARRRQGPRVVHPVRGRGLDGVVAKPLDGAYVPDKRTMLKVKHARTADCVVGAFRWHKSGPVVGSLVLGLHDEQGQLQHVGVAASFPMARRATLVDELRPYLLAEGDAHPWLGDVGSERRPGGEPSRWNRDKDTSFVPLRPELVVEVAYDHMEGARFRHTAQFRSWRPDREPTSCTYAQLERPVRFDLAEVLGA
jgi:ATP-dependent DNA ligase